MARPRTRLAPLVRVTVNLEPEDADLIDRAARMCGVTRLEWLATTAADAARTTVAAMERRPDL